MRTGNHISTTSERLPDRADRVMRSLLLIAPARLAGELAREFDGLAAGNDRIYRVIELPGRSGKTDTESLIGRHASSSDAAIFFADPRSPLHSAVPSLVVGETVVGVVPTRSIARSREWLRSRARAVPMAAPTFAVMAMWKRSYLKWGHLLGEALIRGYAERGVCISSLPADETSRQELCAHFARGIDLAVYVGHGRPTGWSGYRGIRWRHLNRGRAANPSGTVISLACDNLCPAASGRPAFGVQWVMSGRLHAFLGATGSVEIKPMTIVAEFLVDELSGGRHSDTAGLVLAINDRVMTAGDDAVRALWNSFRIVGDPTRSFFRKIDRTP